MKALVVTYLPRGERSKTKNLVDAFLQESKLKGIEVEHLDLLQSQPDFFDEARILAYSLRNYLGETLPPDQAALLSSMDRMTTQFKGADAVVVAFPMYNFSMPALMKAYFDSVMQKGETWDITDTGYAGLMNGKKALVLLTSGGDYSKAPMIEWEHATTLAKNCFQFMGFSDVRSVSAAGINAMPEKADSAIYAGREQVRKIVAEWAKS